MMDVGDTAGDRILDWNHAEIDIAAGERGEAILKGRARDRLVIRIGFAAGKMRVRPRFALENDLFLGHRRRLQPVPLRGPSTRSQPSSARALANSSGVSTPRGALFTTATSMRMPASSARNCSSL